MKKLAIFATLLTLVLSGCAENTLDNIAPEEEQSTIILPDLTAGFADDDVTKTYVEESKYLRWHEADLITAFYGNTLNRQYKFKGKTGDNSGTFSLVPSGELGTGNELDAIYAVYPYDENATITDKGVMTIHLPATQNYAENSFGKGANTMLAVTESVEDTFLGFKNACGYLKLKLYNEGGAMLKSVEVKGNGGEKIAGTATATIEFGGVPAVAMNDDATTSVTLDCGEGIALGTTSETATELWVVLPEVTFEGGITITATDTEGITFEKSTTKPVAITRNEIQPMKALGAEFVAPEPKPANNEIWYTSESEIVFKTNNVFDVEITSHVWDSSTEKGVITFSGDVTKIKSDAFCTVGVSSVHLPDSVVEVEARAFDYNMRQTLQEIKSKYSSADNRCLVIDGTLITFAYWGISDNIYTFPDNIQKIGDYACECSWFEYDITLVLPDSVKEIGHSGFWECGSRLKEVVMGNGVEIIGDRVFQGCNGMTQISFPASVKSIGSGQCISWESPKDLYFRSTVAPNIKEDSFEQYGHVMANFYVPAESVEAYKAAEYWCDYADAIEPYVFE